ncbi:uncharacterized protein LOC119292473 [Triticum dicoccoides]|uniref:uncharacterized protein LOC119292473 n=1 Tax=Triticum dicoccoides TaxID=85692 RepID=UPI00188E9872|nr:uncharacterized protein LOC119292473 [Triticum dicoccoides]
MTFACTWPLVSPSLSPLPPLSSPFFIFFLLSSPFPSTQRAWPGKARGPSPSSSLGRHGHHPRKIQPISSASAEWAFRRTRLAPSLAAEYAGGPLKRWWDWERGGGGRARPGHLGVRFGVRRVVASDHSLPTTQRLEREARERRRHDCPRRGGTGAGVGGRGMGGRGRGWDDKGSWGHAKHPDGHGFWTWHRARVSRWRTPSSSRGASAPSSGRSGRGWRTPW